MNNHCHNDLIGDSDVQKTLCDFIQGLFARTRGRSSNRVVEWMHPTRIDVSDTMFFASMGFAGMAHFKFLNSVEIIALVFFLSSFANAQSADDKSAKDEAMKAALEAVKKEIQRAAMPPQDRARAGFIEFPEDANAAVEKAIDLMRNVVVNQDQVKNTHTNLALDAAWKQLKKFPAIASPRLRDAIASALRDSPRDEFFIFDACDILELIDGEQARSTVTRAMQTVNVNDATIQANLAQMIKMLHRMGRNPTPDTIAMFDHLVLKNRTPVRFFEAPSMISLDAVLIVAAIYGVGGEYAEPHLLNLYSTEGDPVARSLIQTSLVYLGGDKTAVKMREVLVSSAPDNERFTAALLLLRHGGMSGRTFLKNHMEKHPFKDVPQEATQVIANEAKHDVFADEVWASDLDLAKQLTIQVKLSDSDVRERIRFLLANEGRDTKTLGVSIARSTIPAAELLPQLEQIRTLQFRRLSNGAWEAIRTTNKIMNALRSQTSTP